MKISLIKNQILVYGLIIIVAIIAFVVYSVSKNYHLLKARQYSQLAEYDNAVKEYREYLLNNPKDFEVKMEYATVLTDAREYAKALNLLDQVEKELNRTNDKNSLVKVWDSLLKIYLAFAMEANSDGEALLNKEDYAGAKSHFENGFLACQQLRGYLYRLREKYTLDTFKYDPILSINVNYAFSSWVLNNLTDKLRISLFLGDSLTYARYSEKVIEYGHKEFEHKNYQEAERAFKEGWFINTQIGRAASEPYIAAIKYNIGVALSNQSKYDQAHAIFNELKREAPNFKPHI